ncbi:hypothetical protein LSAT2_028984 [Lamellibrachia satsuma]|nr:hypothetical protein LSAT2_028984 [Lamellibrachia satsuma]
MASNILASAATSASYNMALQLMFRLVTFVLNAFVLRYISRELLGVVNVRLTLLYSSTLFLTREAFRRACLSKTSDRRWQQVMNLLWCIIPIGIVCTSVFGYIWALKVLIEGTALTVRCILTVLLVLLFPHWGDHDLCTCPGDIY